MNKKRGLRIRVLGCILALAVLCINFIPEIQSLRLLPESIHMVAGGTYEWDVFFPVRVDVDKEFVEVTGSQNQTLADVGVDQKLTTRLRLVAEEAGDMQLVVKLFGWIPVKSVHVKVLPERYLIPGGQSIGVALHTDGVLVVGITEVGSRSPAREAGLQPGDWIMEAGGIGVENTAHLAEMMNAAGEQGSQLKIRRGQATLEIPIKPEQDGDTKYKIGAWVRDSTAGVGTLTFVDPETGRFAALGHAVTDSDTNQRLTVGKGDVFLSTIIDIFKGQKGEPGELRGVFPDHRTAIGTIDTNTEYGLYGSAADGLKLTGAYAGGLPIGTRASVVEGPATLLTTIDEQGVKEYACRIVHISTQSAPATRSLVVEITDPVLLARTGGIVQGMSGSPILQNGHIIGAITHVYVNDPTRGYGLFVEWMLENGVDKTAA